MTAKDWRKIVGIPSGTLVRLTRDRELPYSPHLGTGDMSFRTFHKGDKGVVNNSFDLDFPDNHLRVYVVSLLDNGIEVWLLDEDIEEIE
jgi:hypothetical protein